MVGPELEGYEGKAITIGKNAKDRANTGDGCMKTSAMIVALRSFCIC
jgi:hypothetical protein